VSVELADPAEALREARLGKTPPALADSSGSGVEILRVS
jgi:hypothetical protein